MASPLTNQVIKDSEVKDKLPPNNVGLKEDQIKRDKLIAQYLSFRKSTATRQGVLLAPMMRSQIMQSQLNIQ